MKKQPNQNVKRNVILISLGIISSFLLIINFIPIFVENAGITTEFTGDLELDRVAYVNQSDPDMNYINPWGWGAPVIGNSCETFVHFNLDLLPKETEELYFFISGGLYDYYYDYDYLIDDIEINLILVESNWNSSEITWNNKPIHEEIIATVNTSEIIQNHFIEYYNLEKAVNLTETIKGNHLNEISFCINITKNNVELNTSVIFSEIQLIWSYEKIIISYTTIVSSFIIFSMLIGTVYYLRKDISTCPECENKRKLTERLCSSCGTNFKKDILTKSSDYQLVSMLLWIFAFSESIYLIQFYMADPFFFPLMSFLLLNWLVFCSIQIGRKIKKYGVLRLNLREI